MIVFARNALAGDLPNFPKQGETIRLWSGFPSFSLLDSYYSRYFPLFRAKNRRTFAPFTTCQCDLDVISMSRSQVRQ